MGQGSSFLIRYGVELVVIGTRIAVLSLMAKFARDCFMIDQIQTEGAEQNVSEFHVLYFIVPAGTFKGCLDLRQSTMADRWSYTYCWDWIMGH